MTRKEAKEILIKSFLEGMKEQGKTENDIALLAPNKGKNTWTYNELLVAVREDKPLENSNYNLIDSYLRYLDWKNKKDNE